jgi:hypothetical protein
MVGNRRYRRPTPFRIGLIKEVSRENGKDGAGQKEIAETGRQSIRAGPFSNVRGQAEGTIGLSRRLVLLGAV